MKIDLDFLSQFSNISIACSGGVDSMVLCDILARNNIKFSLIHCNFKLRGTDSELDYKFVENYAKRNDFKFYSKSFDTLVEVKKNKTSIEIEARNLRYSYFEELASSENIDLILTAHHVNDNVETILMRIINGTGLHGLKGIPISRDIYFRPLLSISKKEIEEYAKFNQVAFRQDLSNFEFKYTRNIIRGELIPIIEKINPSYIQSLRNLSEVSKESLCLLTDIFSSLRDEFRTNFKVNLNLYADKIYIHTIVNFILSDYNFSNSEIKLICSCLKSTESKFLVKNLYKFEIKNCVIELVNEANRIEVQFKTLDDLINSQFFETELFFVSNENIDYKTNCLYFDKAKLFFPLTVRSPRDGDKIVPLGMKRNSKLLIDIFKDKKMLLNQKSKILVLTDSFNEIIGILGFCSSIKTMIDSSTSEILKIEKL